MKLWKIISMIIDLPRFKHNLKNAIPRHSRRHWRHQLLHYKRRTDTELLGRSTHIKYFSYSTPYHRQYIATLKTIIQALEMVHFLGMGRTGKFVVGFYHVMCIKKDEGWYRSQVDVDLWIGESLPNIYVLRAVHPTF